MAKKSKRLDQCVYKEGRRRCIRSGTGTPPLCAAHKIAFATAARRAERPTGVFEQMVEDLVSGRKVTVDQFMGAIGEMAEELKTRAFPGFPGFDPSQIPGAIPRAKANGQAHPRQARPWPGFDPGPSIDPKEEAAKRERIAARQELGFAPSEPITEEILRARHRQLAKKWHPDRPGGSAERMKRVNHAVDVLSASLA